MNIIQIIKKALELNDLTITLVAIEERYGQYQTVDSIDEDHEMDDEDIESFLEAVGAPYYAEEFGWHNHKTKIDRNKAVEEGTLYLRSEILLGAEDTASLLNRFLEEGFLDEDSDLISFDDLLSSEDFYGCVEELEGPLTYGDQEGLDNIAWDATSEPEAYKVTYTFNHESINSLFDVS